MSESAYCAFWTEKQFSFYEGFKSETWNKCYIAFTAFLKCFFLLFKSFYNQSNSPSYFIELNTYDDSLAFERIKAFHHRHVSSSALPVSPDCYAWDVYQHSGLDKISNDAVTRSPHLMFCSPRCIGRSPALCTKGKLLIFLITLPIFLFRVFQELDELKRPKMKVALLCGPPGLGKTTLAHIIAYHAGYHVVEMNAR